MMLLVYHPPLGRCDVHWRRHARAKPSRLLLRRCVIKGLTGWPHQ